MLNPNSPAITGTIYALSGAPTQLLQQLLIWLLSCRLKFRFAGLLSTSPKLRAYARRHRRSGFDWLQDVKPHYKAG